MAGAGRLAGPADSRPGSLVCIGGLVAGRVGPGAVGQAEQVVGTGMVELCQLDQNFGGDVPLAQLVVAVHLLGTVQGLCQLFLGAVAVLPQGTDPWIHCSHPPH